MTDLSPSAALDLYRHLPAEQALVRSLIDILHPDDPEPAPNVPQSWVTDPAVFVRECLGHRSWAKQDEILRAIAEPRAKVSVKGCHASSKTFALAEALIWWLGVMRGICVTTSPSFKHSTQVLWGEVHEALDGADTRLLNLPPPDLTQIRVGPKCWAAAIAAREVQGFTGRHGKVAVFIDEAPAVGSEFIKALLTSRASGDVRIVMSGNPTEIGGAFYDSFESDQSTWTGITISAWDTPNFAHLLPRGRTGSDLTNEEAAEILRAATPEQLAYAPWPELCLPSYALNDVLESAEYAGGDPNHPDFESRIMARFPRQHQHGLIPLDAIETAAGPTTEPGPGRLSAGVDVAGAGKNETVIYIVDGPNVVHFASTTQRDDRDWADRELEPYRDRLDLVNVDEAGVGEKLVLYLGDRGYPVQGVNVGRRAWGATDPEEAKARARFALLKDQVYWWLRERFIQGDIRGLTDKMTRQQLATLRYELKQGKIRMEQKASMSKRGLASPDRAESLMLAYVPRLTKRTRKRAGSMHPRRRRR